MAMPTAKDEAAYLKAKQEAEAASQKTSFWNIDTSKIIGTFEASSMAFPFHVSPELVKQVEQITKFEEKNPGAMLKFAKQMQARFPNENPENPSQSYMDTMKAAAQKMKQGDFTFIKQPETIIPVYARNCSEVMAAASKYYNYNPDKKTWTLRDEPYEVVPPDRLGDIVAKVPRLGDIAMYTKSCRQ